MVRPCSVPNWNPMTLAEQAAEANIIVYGRVDAHYPMDDIPIETVNAKKAVAPELFLYFILLHFILFVILDFYPLIYLFIYLFILLFYFFGGGGYCTINNFLGQYFLRSRFSKNVCCFSLAKFLAVAIIMKVFL